MHTKKREKAGYLLLSFLLAMLLIPYVNAQVAPRYTQQCSEFETDALTLASADIIYAPKDENIFFYTQLFDKNGKQLTTSQGECSFFITSPTGERLYALRGNENLTIVSDTGWRADVNASYLSELGHYQFLWSCTHLVSGGCFKGDFMVTETGQFLTLEQTMIYIFCILLVISLFIISTYLFIKSRYATSSSMEEAYGVLENKSSLHYYFEILRGKIDNIYFVMSYLSMWLFFLISNSMVTDYGLPILTSIFSPISQILTLGILPMFLLVCADLIWSMVKAGQGYTKYLMQEVGY